MKDEKRWYIIYTKTKAERKTVEIFEKKQIPVYSPEYNKMCYSHGKARFIKLPLMPSLLFAFLAEEQLERVIKISGVVGFLYKMHKPAVVKGKEIDAMQIFLATHNNVTVEKVPMNCSDHNSSQPDYYNNADIDIPYGIEKLILPSLGYCLVAKSKEAFITNVA